MECAAQGDCDRRNPQREWYQSIRVRMECAAQGDCDDQRVVVDDDLTRRSEWSAPLKAIVTW